MSLYEEQSCGHRCSVSSTGSIDDGDDDVFDRLEEGQVPVVALLMTSVCVNAIVAILLLDPG